MITRHAKRMEKRRAQSPVDRLKQRIGALETRLAALKDLDRPLSTLYAAFSDEQKSKADALMSRIGCMM